MAGHRSPPDVIAVLNGIPFITRAVQFAPPLLRPRCAILRTEIKRLRIDEDIDFRMALAGEVKIKTITQFRIHKTDTGSPEVQVAILSQRIN